MKQNKILMLVLLLLLATEALAATGSGVAEAVKVHWLELLLGLMALAKVVVNITPTDKDNQIFGIIDAFINRLIPNRKKGGGAF